MMDVIDREEQIKAILEGEGRVKCATKHGNISVATCLIRQGNAMAWKHKCETGFGSAALANKPGAGDISCESCEQGKALMEKQEEPAVEEEADKIKTLIDLICLEEGINRADLYKPGRSKKKFRPVRVKIAQALREEGLHAKEIAVKIGCPIGSVWSYISDKMPDPKKTRKAPDPKEDFGLNPGREELEKTQEAINKRRSKALVALSEAPDPNILTIDFNKYPETLEKIYAFAERRLRTPGDQALWLLVNMEQLG